MLFVSAATEDWTNLRTRDYNRLLEEMIQEISGGEPQLLTGGQLHMLTVAARIASEHYKPLIDYVSSMKEVK